MVEGRRLELESRWSLERFRVVIKGSKSLPVAGYRVTIDSLKMKELRVFDTNKMRITLARNDMCENI